METEFFSLTRMSDFEDESERSERLAARRRCRACPNEVDASPGVIQASRIQHPLVTADKFLSNSSTTSLRLKNTFLEVTEDAGMLDRLVSRRSNTEPHAYSQEEAGNLAKLLLEQFRSSPGSERVSTDQFASIYDELEDSSDVTTQQTMQIENFPLIESSIDYVQTILLKKNYNINLIKKIKIIEKLIFINFINHETAITFKLQFDGAFLTPN